MIYINDDTFADLKNTVVCLGNFDGVHIGHQELLHITKSFAKESKYSSVVFSFFPHPRIVLSNHHIVSLTTPKEKRNIFEYENMDYYIEYPFNKNFASLSPNKFIKDIIVKKLGCEILVVGEGYKFGSGKSGNKEVLEKLCLKYNIKLILVPHIMYGDVKVSSSNIRKYVLENNFSLAEELMGRPYFVSGKIIHGKKIGRTIGFPTANLIPSKYKLLPKSGVYITKSKLNKKIYNSITNIGRNPTVNGKSTTVETFIFDYDKDLYGKYLEVYFYKNLRDEIKFENVTELKSQMEKDKLKALEFHNSEEAKNL